ncbi:SDR family oxidoreductase [Siphonobacter aquaeclarae]|uniref:Nucleoside-diphosphate-sugar epimerase n=1 Tax=Siphonobacter aquaeclarae TaxID=563176 RepID=A0A1G9K2P2_9BACT|nr:SDR family oxidoreductase [Siphonobacter aquaeclarae]SDL44180.1 Nucleoside-diphosphate-sugar epimerase [Siphonobacter aquaeclarae]
MRVFVTGASGFVGSEVVRELTRHGHEVLGLVRSEEGAAHAAAAGATPLPGDVNDFALLRHGVSQTDAVIHTAFNHDFSRFKANCEDDRLVIGALGEALAGTDKPLVITSGIGLLRANRPVTEEDGPVAGSDVNPRVATEEAARAVSEKGVDVYLVRLPPSVHGAGDRGFVPMLIDLARNKGVSAFTGEGTNRWPAVHRQDAAALYRLAIEKRPSLKVLHAVAETGIPFREIAETIGKGLSLPVAAMSGEDIAAHFTWFAHFAVMDCAASAERTRRETGWEPTGSGLLSDIREAGYLAV